MAVVLTMVMLCSSMAFAEGEMGLLISSGPVAAENAPQLTQEEINKNASGFFDIAPDAPYLAAVKKLVDFGIIAGYPDGTFKPEGEVTRAEMCKMINLTLGFTDFGDVPGFRDVTVNNWYFTYALAAQKQGYVEGYEDKTFRGGNNITRQEVCAILNRLLKPMDLGIPVTINDAVSNWARPHVELIVQNFIMPLEEGNTFRATENLKRHELATVLSNMAIGPVQQIDADVRFFVNGEQYGDTQTVFVGECAVQPADPQAPGPEYEFDGWRQIGTEDVVDVKAMVVTADVDYEAVFVKKMHNVTFYSRGAVYETRIALYGDVVSAPENPDVKGYDFLGWALSENGDVIKLSQTKIYNDSAFYAVFEKLEDKDNESGAGGGGAAPPAETSYNVKFFVNGDLYETQKVLKNKSPKTPDDPERDGYIFVGWSFETNGEIINPKSIKVTGSVTLYAVFEEEKEEEPEVFTVTFYADGKKHETQFVQAGETVSSVSAPKKNGYIFKYWSKTENGSEVMLGYYKVDSDTKFYAVFEKEEEQINYYTVTFIVDGDEYSSSTVQEGKKASAPTAPAKEGYNFKGWSKTDGGSVSSVSVTVNENLTFYAVFEKIEPKKFTVSFIVDGEVVSEQTVLEKETADLPANPVKEGYKFLGWAERKDGEVVNVGSFVIEAPKSFYAVFEEKEEEIKTYTVTFVVDGKTVSSLELVEGAKVTIPDDPEKDSHKFLGWSKTNGGSVVTVEATAKSNVTYYAVFEQIKKFNVTFIVDGKDYKKVSVVEGETASAPSTPSVDGYKFLGWSKTNGGDVVEVGSVKITADTVFYAILEEVEPEKVFFTVTFKAEDKNFSTVSVEEGQYASAPSGEPEKSGYTFKGWATKSNGSPIDVSSVKISANTTFYAVFEKDPVYHEVVFVSDGEEYNKQKVLEGDYPDVPKDPKLDGYEFLGWSKTNGGSTVYPDSIAVTGDTTYYAVFKEAEEEIKYYKVFFWVDGEYYKDYEVASGDTVRAPVEPTPDDDGLFLGWSLDDSNNPDEIIEVADIVIEKDTDFYSVIVRNPNSDELMEKLGRGHSQLKKIRLGGIQKQAVNIITECVGYIIDDANNGEYINKQYVSKNYSDMIDDVKDLFNVTMTSEERSGFVNAITDERNIDKDVQDFLIDYFDINTSI